jgi:hypothetical protein
MKTRQSFERPTNPQRRILKALADYPESYIQYRFDLGGALLRCGDLIVGALPGMPTIDACHSRGWIEFVVHQWGNNTVQIERRYTLTEAGRQVLQA